MRALAGEHLLWQLSQLRPFWKPAGAPFMPGLLPGAMIWLGFGFVLEDRQRMGFIRSDASEMSNPVTIDWCSLAGANPGNWDRYGPGYARDGAVHCPWGIVCV